MQHSATLNGLTGLLKIGLDGYGRAFAHAAFAHAAPLHKLQLLPKKSEMPPTSVGGLFITTYTRNNPSANPTNGSWWIFQLRP